MKDDWRENGMDKIIVIGGKGSAVVIGEQIYDTQMKTGAVEFMGFAFDDEAFGTEINGFPILCKTYDAYEMFKNDKDVKFIFALYRPDLMKERIALRDSYGIPLDRYAIFVHHSAYVAKSARLGYGCVVLANSVVNTNAKLGNFNMVQSNSLIGHDTVVGDSNFFAAHSVIGSNNVIGDANFFGLNVSLNNYICIGSDVFVGMASNVIKSIESGAMVYGNPARQVERKIKPL